MQAALAAHLQTQGWSISAQADTETKEPGIDLVAELGDRRVAVEVKGYPEVTYAHGERRGKPKPTRPASQARQWFSHALLAMMTMRSKEPQAEIALCFPEFPTYSRLLGRSDGSLELLGVGYYSVHEDGSVERMLDHRSPNGPDSPQLSPRATSPPSTSALQHWTGDELVERLGEFERELKAAGLSPNTIATYVGRSEIFIRWLSGDYTPRGPSTRTEG